MPDIIHLLPDSVANQIAAGEVIQRPASVIKELVENSIDAGATHIQIILKDAGRTLIHVIDNGKGMSETDARMAFERHATSKITSADDLFAIRTMGFRGEALASIAAVSQVELRTRRKEEELGVLLEVAASRLFKQEVVRCDVGSSFQVKNLFFNVPARRRFLKSDNVEKNHILNEFYRIALVNNEVAFVLYDNDIEVYNLPPSNIKLRIENVFGKNSKKRWNEQLLTIETETSVVKISGYVGKPEFAQKSATQYFFVNGRFMKHPYFHKAVVLAYNQLIQASDSPNYFIYLDVDPQAIDINIHPTKTEIKFENEQAIWSILNATIKESLGKFNIFPSIDFDREGAVDFPKTPKNIYIEAPKTSFNPNYNPFHPVENSKRFIPEWEKLYGESAFATKSESILPTETDSNDQRVNGELKLIESSSSFSAICQFNNGYIFAFLTDSIIVIDQQKAHTRVLYDKFSQQLTLDKMPSQQLLFPEVLGLDKSQQIWFEQILPIITNLGFDIEETEDTDFLIKGIPSLIDVSKVVQLILDMIHHLENTEQVPDNQIREMILMDMAKSASIKQGQRLTDDEMRYLIDSLFCCKNHHFTPDGKKIISWMDLVELERKF